MIFEFDRSYDENFNCMELDKLSNHINQTPNFHTQTSPNQEAYADPTYPHTITKPTQTLAVTHLPWTKLHLETQGSLTKKTHTTFRNQILSPIQSSLKSVCFVFVFRIFVFSTGNRICVEKRRCQPSLFLRNICFLFFQKHKKKKN